MAREGTLHRDAPAGDRAGASGTRAEELGERLSELLEEPLAGALEQLSSGASRETFIFATPSRGQLVLQAELVVDEGRPAQAPLLRAAARAGVPVPRVVADGRDDPVLGPRWIVLESVPGTSDPNVILAGEQVPPSGELLDSLAAALAAVHRMPADPALAPPLPDPLAQLRSQHDRLCQPHPTFELAFRVLGEDRPPPRHTLVHGDFRVGNLLVGPQGVTGVLDWELTHLGDPVEDLGWLCVPAWRFARVDRPAAGLGTREQLLVCYERHAGVGVDRAALARWELAGTLRWGVICVMQAFRHLSGAMRSVEHAVIGRRACEVEWDLLEMLDPAGSAAPPAAERSRPASDDDGARASRPLHDRPSALELLDAARGAMGDEVLPQVHGRAAFQLRVAMRALGIVRRELEHADEHRAQHAQALSRLGVAGERELAAQIRAGAFDERRAELCAQLRAIVRAKLEAANPRYVRAYTPTAKEAQ